MKLLGLIFTLLFAAETFAQRWDDGSGRYDETGSNYWYYHHAPLVFPAAILMFVAPFFIARRQAGDWDNSIAILYWKWLFIYFIGMAVAGVFSSGDSTSFLLMSVAITVYGLFFSKTDAQKQKEAAEGELINKFVENHSRAKQLHQNNKVIKEDVKLERDVSAANEQDAGVVTSHERNEVFHRLKSLDPAFIGYAGSENLIQKANLGDVEAQYALATLYFSGCDVFAPDYELAKRYFYLAAKSGHKISKIIVAELENGRLIYNKKNQKFAFLNATKINDIQSLSIKSQEKDLDEIENKKIESKLIEIIKKKMLDSKSIVKTTWLRKEDTLVNIDTSESFNIVRHHTFIKEQVEEYSHGYRFSPSTGYSYVTNADVWNVWSSNSSSLTIKELSDSSRIAKDWAKFGDALIHIPTCKEFKIFRNCRVPLRGAVNEDEHGFLFNPNDRHFFVKHEDVHLIISDS